MKSHTSNTLTPELCRLLPIRAFSLVELLTVVAIIGLLMTATAPMLRNVTSSSSLVNGANLLTGLMNQARVHAISNNTQTALYLCADWPGQPDDALRMASVWSWNADRREWVQITKWERLPTGIVLQPTAPTGAPPGQGEYFAFDTENLANSRNVVVNGKTVRVFEIRFNSLGAVTVDAAAPAAANPLRQIQLRLIPGHASGATITHTTSENWVDVFTDGLTGRVRSRQR